MYLFGVMWTLGRRIRKTVGCFKYCLMCNTSRSMEDSGAYFNLITLGIERFQRIKMLVCCLETGLMIFW